jgi:uncharacterized protein (DUF983 family)
MDAMTFASEPRPALRSMLRGLRGRCPCCGTGKLFYRYLKIEPVCQTCGHDLERYPADDGPAYFTVLIVGHLVIVPFLILCAPLIWKAPLWIIKGAVVGLLYALDITRADARLHTADAAE